MTLNHKHIRSGRNEAGFSLIEVLIALVIMSVGMLGIAGLYVESMQAGRTAIFRHNAVTLASDVADRIRANPSAGADYEGIRGNNNCVLGNVDCDPTQMASNDIDLWKTQADGMLPNGDVTITFDNNVSPPTYEIVVTWDEANEAQTYTILIPAAPSPVTPL